MPHKIQYLTEPEIECKFQEFSMERILQGCIKKPASRDPDLLLIPPYTSVAHKREWGFLHKTLDGSEISLIFYWVDAGGDERRSIRWFVFGNVKYRLRFTIATP